MGELLCIIPGPSYVYRAELDEQPDRWCFKCRRRGQHTWVLLGDPPPPDWVIAQLYDPGLDGYAKERLHGYLTYYDPQWFLRCPSCGEDHTGFPGRPR